MSGWIKFWKDMPSDPRVLSAAMKLSERYILAHRTSGMGGADLSITETCNAWRNAVTGALATLWAYADEHIRDDDTLPLTSQTVDAVVGLEGFFDVMPREWIDELNDGSIILPGYCEKNSLIAKRKRTIKSNARVTQWRMANKSNGNGVTGKHVTQHTLAGDLDQDIDLDKSRKEERTAAAPPRVPREASTDQGWFLDFKLAYPPRDGDPGWSKAKRAANARIAEGHTTEEFIDGAKRYAAYVLVKGDSGTEFVKQASTFLGPDKPFLLPWTPPASKAQKAQDANVSASLEWLRRDHVAS